MSNSVKHLLRAVQRVEEKAKVYQFLINYLSEIVDGLGNSSEAGVALLSPEVIVEVTEELHDRREDILDSADSLVAPKELPAEPKKKKAPKLAPRKAPRKKPPKKSPE